MTAGGGSANGDHDVVSVATACATMVVLDPSSL